MILVFDVLSETSLAGQTAVFFDSVRLSLIFAWSPIMQPLLIFTFFPMVAASPITAPFMDVLSSILVSGKITVLLICTFFPMVTFFPRMAYGPIIDFSPIDTFLSSAVGVFVSYLPFLGFCFLVSESRIILFVWRYSSGLPMSIHKPLMVCP